MKRVVLLHTVKSVYETFEGRVREAVPELELKVHNMLDEFLATDAAPQEHGRFTARNKARLRLQLRAAGITGADLIVVTCSQLSMAARRFARRMPTPLVTIDEAMVEKAVQHGPRIALISTAAGTLAPMRESLLAEAARQKRPIEIQEIADERAIRALKAGDAAQHDRIVREMAERVRDCDVAILAQASGAHMEAEIAAITGLTTFTSPALCLARIREILLGERGKRP